MTKGEFLTVRWNSLLSLGMRKSIVDKTSDASTLSGRLVSYLRAELESTALGLALPLTRLQGGCETSTYRSRSV